VNAVDANWNVINTVTDLVGITSSDTNAMLPPNAALVAGTQNFNVTLNTPGTATVTASDLTDPGSRVPNTPVGANTSPAITVNAASLASSPGKMCVSAPRPAYRWAAAT